MNIKVRIISFVFLHFKTHLMSLIYSGVKIILLITNYYLKNKRDENLIKNCRRVKKKDKNLREKAMWVIFYAISSCN